MAYEKFKVQTVFVSTIVFYSLNFSCAFDLLTTLWDEDVPLRRALAGDRISDEDSKILIRRLSKLPFTEQAKSDAWYKILQYRRVETLDVDDWQKYEPLLPNLPISVLRRINISNEFILAYFGQQKLKQVQLTLLAEEVAMMSKNVLDDEEKILKLGNIICGFSPGEIKSLKDSTLRFLMEKDFFHSIKACSTSHLSIFTKLVKRFSVMGPPRIWKPETVRKAGSLIAGLSPSEIGEIRETSFSQINSEVIELTPFETLKEVRDSQLKTLNKSALLTWRRKTRDLRVLYLGKCSSYPAEILLMAIMSGLLIMK